MHHISCHPASHAQTCSLPMFDFSICILSPYFNYRPLSYLQVDTIGPTTTVRQRLADAVIVGADSSPIAGLLVDYCAKRGIKPPVLLHHKMMRSLANPAELMSKKNPQSTVFVTDTDVCHPHPYSHSLSSSKIFESALTRPSLIHRM